MDLKTNAKNNRLTCQASTHGLMETSTDVHRCISLIVTPLSLKGQLKSPSQKTTNHSIK